MQKFKLKDITEGFEFELNGKKVIVSSDYEKWDKNFTSVQIVHADNPKLSDGCLQKAWIVAALNKDKKALEKLGFK